MPLNVCRSQRLTCSPWELGPTPPGIERRTWRQNSNALQGGTPITLTLARCHYTRDAYHLRLHVLLNKHFNHLVFVRHRLVSYAIDSDTIEVAGRWLIIEIWAKQILLYLPVPMCLPVCVVFAFTTVCCLQWLPDPALQLTIKFRRHVLVMSLISVHSLSVNETCSCSFLDHLLHVLLFCVHRTSIRI